MIGISDVDYMDYDTGYYTTDYQVLRLTVRQLYSWPADPGHEHHRPRLTWPPPCRWSATTA